VVLVVAVHDRAGGHSAHLPWLRRVEVQVEEDADQRNFGVYYDLLGVELYHRFKHPAAVQLLSDFLEACNIFQKVKEIAQNAINLSVSKFIGTGLLTLIQLILSNWLQELHILVSTVFK